MQKNLQNLKKIYGQKNMDRFQQTPKPNYPNFELRKSSIGEIGWGTKTPDPYRKYNDGKRKHVFIWDKNQDQKFLDLTGNFSQNLDKGDKLNQTVFNLMNVTGQRAHIQNKIVSNPYARPEMNN